MLTIGKNVSNSLNNIHSKTNKRMNKMQKQQFRRK